MFQVEHTMIEQTQKNGFLPKKKLKLLDTDRQKNKIYYYNNKGY